MTSRFSRLVLLHVVDVRHQISSSCRAAEHVLLHPTEEVLTQEPVQLLQVAALPLPLQYLAMNLYPPKSFSLPMMFSCWMRSTLLFTTGRSRQLQHILLAHRYPCTNFDCCVPEFLHLWLVDDHGTEQLHPLVEIHRLQREAARPS